MSYIVALYHIVFSTKGREATLDKEHRAELFSFIAGIVKRKGCKPIIVNGGVDHVHILLDLSSTMTLSEVVKEIKRSSTLWIKERKIFPMFSHWESEYGAFSVLVQWYAEPKLLFDVPPHCFVPQPKVTSTVVRMDRRAAPPASVDDKKLFFRTVRAAFAQRRKTLSNALRSGFSELDRAAIESAMEETGLPPAVRGETLSIAQFAALSNALLRKFDK